MNITELSKLVKAYGKDKIFVGGELKSSKGRPIDLFRLPFGIYPLDYALGGGLPLNVPVQLFGPPESGKTTLSIRLARMLSQTCLNYGCCKPLSLCTCEKPRVVKTFLCYVEGIPPDKRWYRTLRYDYGSNLVLALPDTAEEAMEMVDRAIDAEDCGLIIIDSIGGMLSKAELSADYDDDVVGKFSRLMTRFAKRISIKLTKALTEEKLVGFLCLNQIRSSIGSFVRYGSSETVAGGNAFRHLVRLSMRVSQLSPGTKGRDTDNLKNFLKFSVSLLGEAAKQQVFIMAGKCEFRINADTVADKISGAPDDWDALRKDATSLGVCRKTEGGMVFGNITVPSLSDLEDLYMQDGMEAYEMRYLTVQEAKKAFEGDTRIVSEKAE